MGVLIWDKPKRAMKVEEWKSLSADGAPPGVYTPNMSREDMLKWKGKLVKGEDPRVEIRKTFYFSNGKQYPEHVGYGSQVVVTVRLQSDDNPNVLISTNGKIAMSFDDYKDLNMAIGEAMNELYKSKKDV